MQVQGSLTDMIRIKRDRMALVVVHLQSKTGKSASVAKAAARIAGECVKAGAPIFLFTQTFMKDFDPNGPCGIVAEVRDASTSPKTVCITQHSGNVFADTDLEQQLEKAGCKDVIVIGTDGAACVMATAVGRFGAQEPSLLNGAVQRGLTVHTHWSAICTGSLPSSWHLAWLDFGKVRSYVSL